VDWDAGLIITGPREEDKYSIEANWEAVIDAVADWDRQQRNAAAYAARALAIAPAQKPTLAHEASPAPSKGPPLVAPADEDGAPPGPLRFRFTYDESDAPLVEEITDGVKSGRFRSIWHGGTELAPRAKGSGKGDSKAHRLTRKAKTVLISQGWTGLNSTDPS
jgi:hypothetical protein